VNAPPSFKTIRISQLRALAAKEPRGWLIRNVPLLPCAGLVLVVGEPLAGKSSLCAAVATAMAVGLGVGGRPVGLGRTLWVSGEHTTSDASSKFERACRGAGATVEELEDDVHFSAQPDWTLDSAEDVAAMRAYLDEHDIDFVVLDSFRRFSAVDENSSQGVADALKQVRALAVDPATGQSKRLVAVIHHLGRNGQPRGSTDFKAVVDSVVRVERMRTGWRLRAEHHTAAPFSCEANVTETDELLRVDALGRPTGPATEDGLADAVKEALTKSGSEGLGKSDLRAAVRPIVGGAKSAAIDACVQKLFEDGLVERGKGSRGRVIHKLALGAAQNLPYDPTTPARRAPPKGEGTGRPASPSCAPTVGQAGHGTCVGSSPPTCAPAQDAQQNSADG
jgi:hypothetical protein